MPFAALFGVGSAGRGRLPGKFCAERLMRTKNQVSYDPVFQVPNVARPIPLRQKVQRRLSER